MAITKIQSESMNLADTYAFTGTVTGAGGVNTPSFLATQSAQQSIATTTSVKLQCNTEAFDTDNTYDNSTNYRFTPAVAGKYYLMAMASLENLEADRKFYMSFSKNGSFLSGTNHLVMPGAVDNVSNLVSFIDTANTTDYYEAFIYHTSDSAKSTVVNATFFGAYKIIT